MPKTNSAQDDASRAAQAAFRARRANYIATLEETVTSLESVVLQLQDSCREARAEAQQLRQENASIRHEYRKIWQIWQSRKGENDDLPPLPQPILNGHMGSSSMHQYGAEGMAYRTHDEAALCNGQYNAGPSHSYSHSPSMPYTGSVGTDVSGGETSPHPLTQRSAKYGPYAYSVHGTHRDQSFSASESPTLTGFPGDEQKASINNLDTAPYVFPGSRSISPSSTTPSSSSASLTSPFQFAFSENAERAEYDYRRNSNPRSDVGIHGQTPKLGTRRADSSADRPILPILPPLSHDRGSSDGDSNSYAHPRLRPRRDSLISPPSRSSSPTVPPQLSGTLAVIKAQAFGALRRTRARTKKTSDGAAKTALDVLEARGIEMGVSSGSKRQRTDDSDDGEIQT
ncbi:hypothetical protein C8J57DRAFT_1429373 [Mycena rebaudengoi]|nr:hypothetical protein C8J57DRAFT_1429373 [Mycena rebaudengoi]